VTDDAAAKQTTGDNTMLSKLLIVGLAVLITACAPIPQEPPDVSTDVPPKTETSPQVSPYDNECFEDQLLMLPGQSVEVPMSDELPDHVDIVGVSSDLDGETLFATFHLRDIPEELDLSTEDAKVNRAEYTLVVFISLEHTPDDEFFKTDYILGANYSWERPAQDTTEKVSEAATMLLAAVWEMDPAVYEDEDEEEEGEGLPYTQLENKVDVVISDQDNTLTLVGQIPGITDESAFIFSNLQSEFPGTRHPYRDYVPCNAS